MSNTRLRLFFDMRAPDFGAPITELYSAAIEMAAFADRIGLDGVGLMQHHGSEDGYLPQPYTLAGGMAAVTKKLQLVLGAIVLPLHDPVELAEQTAVLDIMSNGRLSVVFAAGYVPSEFAMFNKSMRDRAKLMDDGLDIILRALRGERFEKNGRPIFVRPLPVRAPEDIIMVGGGVPASARRAAWFDVGFFPMAGELVDLYLAECAKLGREPREYVRPAPGMPLSIHLCEDPEAGWKLIEPHAVHAITEYAKWAEQEGDGSNSPFRSLTDPAVLRQAGLYSAWTPEQLLETVRTAPEIGQIGFYPLLGGLAPEEGWKSLKLLEQVMPGLRKALAARA